ncbi:MAG TPA: hypothetical protein VN028_03685 [Rhodocyclaceae bacterium]|nr:hypothetical protein [Rhodocyclaceae bacterium]
MNKDFIVGNWRQFAGWVVMCWGRLNRDSAGILGGRRARLAGRIQASGGAARMQADRQLRRFAAQHKGKLLDKPL